MEQWRRAHPRGARAYRSALLRCWRRVAAAVAVPPPPSSFGPWIVGGEVVWSPNGSGLTVVGPDGGSRPLGVAGYTVAPSPSRRLVAAVTETGAVVGFARRSSAFPGAGASCAGRAGVWR